MTSLDILRDPVWQFLFGVISFMLAFFALFLQLRDTRNKARAAELNAVIERRKAINQSPHYPSTTQWTANRRSGGMPTDTEYRTPLPRLPRVVVLISVLHMLCGALVLLSLFIAYARLRPLGEASRLALIPLTGSGVLLLLAGVGLRLRQPWAWSLVFFADTAIFCFLVCVVLATFLGNESTPNGSVMFTILIGLAIACLLSVWYLTRPPVRTIFGL